MLRKFWLLWSFNYFLRFNDTKLDVTKNMLEFWQQMYSESFSFPSNTINTSQKLYRSVSQSIGIKIFNPTKQQHDLL